MRASDLLQQRWKLVRLSVFALLLPWLAGCQTLTPGMSSASFASNHAATASPIGDLPAPVERTWPDPAQDVLNQRARNFGLVNAPEMQRYLNGLYARIKTKAGVPAWPGSVYILANEALSAYATAAGNIYLSLPWLSSVESEDELVALLSHEFGHIYLHYHQLEGALDSANTAAGLVGTGIAIVNETEHVKGWTQLDSFTTAYMLGRGLATTLYSQSQERAADSFGLNLSLKLGYSYEHGMKAFLERIASWEEHSAQREKEQHELLLKTLRQQSKDAAIANNGGHANALNQATGEIGGSISAALHQLAFDFKQGSAKLRSDHPDTTERIDALAVAIEAYPEILENTEPVTRPLKNVLKGKRTAGIFKNYTLAFQAINSPTDPSSLQAARNAVKGPTATHAVPLLALYTVLNEQQPAKKNKRTDHGKVLEANFRSEADRAWITYSKRSQQLKEARKRTAALKVMESGHGFFRNAEETWPDVIRFYGETKGWSEAKRIADICSKHYRRMSTRCNEAAISPSEQAQIKRQEEEKADAIVKKMLNKK